MGADQEAAAKPAGGTKHTAFIKENFGTVWPVHLVGFTRLLVQLRAHIQDDLDLMLVLAVIGGRTQDARWNAGLAALGQLTRDEDTQRKQLPINIQSISEFTGIPRETVRRKLVILEEKGWVSLVFPQ
jgi:CRP-like cAMP-binding protein